MATTQEEKPSSPISLRLTPDERRRLEDQAHGQGMSAYIRSRLFGSEMTTRRSRVATADARQLAHVLAALGQSGIAESLREISQAAKMGTLPMTPETEAAIAMACGTIAQMRGDLLRALGLREDLQP